MGAQSWNAQRYAEHARFVVELAAPLLDLLAPRPGERILDLGCGDGALTTAIAATGAYVVGVDSSSEMVTAARGRGIDARLDRGESLSVFGPFDAVFSNAALHWMDDLDPVFAGVARVLCPGGRFVGEMGAAGNIATVVAALAEALERRALNVPQPWTFPEPKTVASLLERNGFAIDLLDRIDRPTVIPGDLSDWLKTFAGAHLATIPDTDRADLIEAVRAALRPALHSSEGWTLDYIRLRFVARLQAGSDGPRAVDD